MTLLEQITSGQFRVSIKLLSHYCVSTEQQNREEKKKNTHTSQVVVTTMHDDVLPPGHIGSTSCHCQRDLWTGSRNGHAVHHLAAKKTVEMCAVVDSGAQNNVYTTIGRNSLAQQ